jgi:hypothetical protein
MPLKTIDRQECNRAPPGRQYVCGGRQRRRTPGHPVDEIQGEFSAMKVDLRRALSVVVLAGLAAGAALRVIYAAERPGADEVWSTKKVMDRIALGKQSLLAAVNADLRKAEPDWKRDEERLTEVIRLMSMLTRHKPPRGSQVAWDRLVRDYVDGAKAARQSVKEHRLRPARDALDKARAACEECHDNHGVQ